MSGLLLVAYVLIAFSRYGFTERVQLVAVAQAGSGQGGLARDEQTWDSGGDTRAACAALSRFSHVAIVGDSLARQAAQGMMMLLQDNLLDGGMRTWDVPAGLNCSGEMQFSQRDCRLYALTGTSQLRHPPSCAARVAYHDLWEVEQIPAAEELSRLIPLPPGACILLMPPGLHGYLQRESALLDGYVLPILHMAASVRGARAVIVGVHRMESALAAEHAAHQNEATIGEFNEALRAAADRAGVDYLDVYNVSAGMYSADGVHYGVDGTLKMTRALLSFLGGPRVLFKRGGVIAGV